MTYLGTNLSPSDYYSKHSVDYVNAHEPAVVELLEKLSPNLSGKVVLDLGCGPGLATQTLQKKFKAEFAGVDSSPVMIKRYEEETSSKGYVKSFWEDLPQSNIIFACHSLHLCPDERLYQTKASIKRTNAKSMIITAPNKHLIEKFDFKVETYLTACFGEKRKTIHGWKVFV